MPADRLTAPDRRAGLGERQFVVVQFLLFFGGYAAVISWFRFVDVYHAHFADTGVLIFVHNMFRLLFIFYLFWIVQVAGAILLRLAGRLRPDRVGVLNYLAMTFFAGTGPWHVVMLAIGYAGLLNAGVMILLTAPMVALSFREFRIVAPGLRAALAQVEPDGKLFKALVVLVGVSWGTLLVVKGLYPGNGELYYEPYFSTYKAFVTHGSLQPHESWWVSIYAQGAGLFFLGMLLTDAMAPQLVTFCLLSVSGLVTCLFIRTLAPRTYWPLVGTSLFFAFFIYTPGWGEFRKLHEFNTSFVIAIVWLMVMAFVSVGQARRIWLCAAAATMTAAIIVSNYIGVFLGAVFGLLALAYVLRGERERALACFGLAGLGGVLVACTLAINYAVYGLFNGWDPSLVLLWRFADIEKVYRLGALPNVMFVYLRIVSDIAVGANIPWAGFLIRALRLEVLWPLFLGGLLIAVFSAYQRLAGRGILKRRIPDAALVLVAVLAVYVPLALFLGRSQSSFYRFSSFIVPVMIVAGIALWTMPLRDVAAQPFEWFGRPFGPIAALLLCAAMLIGKTRFDPDVLRLGAHALEYSAGIMSMDDAYAQRSVGGSVALSGGIYPGVRGAYAIVGPHMPMLSLNSEAFCLLPDCKLTTFALILIPGIEQLLWGTPDEGRALLQAAGLNYFLLSRQLGTARPLPLSDSPLFSPDNINRYLGIRWTDGTTALLTWSGPDTAPLDENWLADYRRLRRPLKGVDTRLRAMFVRLQATPHPWHPSDLPWR